MSTPYVRLPTKKADPRCSCVPGQYDCGFCSGIRRQRIWNAMGTKEKAYDRHVAPTLAAALDAGRYADTSHYERGCSCHISPPCGFCCSSADEDEAGQ